MAFPGFNKIPDIQREYILVKLSFKVSATINISGENSRHIAVIDIMVFLLPEVVLVTGFALEPVSPVFIGNLSCQFKVAYLL